MSARTTNEYFDSTVYVCVRVTAGVVVVGSVLWAQCVMKKRKKSAHAHTHTSTGQTRAQVQIRTQIRMKIGIRHDDDDDGGDRLKCFQSENIRVDCCWRTFQCRRRRRRVFDKKIASSIYNIDINGTLHSRVLAFRYDTYILHTYVCLHERT